MPRGRDERPRVLGPTWLPSMGYWRIVVITPSAPDPKERRATRYYRDQAEAEEDALAARNLIERSTALTIEEAIDAYEQHLKTVGTIGYAETIRRLRLFFPDLKMPLTRVSPERGKGYYSAFRERKKKNGDPISVAYHRAALINARSLFTWCIEQGWVPLNPLTGIKGVGRRKSGKRKPTGDELRKLYDYCWPLVEKGDKAALGVMMVLSMALRSSDVTRRLVRDVDLDGTQLIVEGAKTEESNEPRIIPDDLQPFVRRLAANRSPFEPLFKTPYTKSGHHTQRWLQEAMRRFCEGAAIPYVCPHALKGTSGTVLAKKGAAGNIIMGHLSHREESTTYKHYVNRDLVDGAQAREAFKVIAGGRR